MSILLWVFGFIVGLFVSKWIKYKTTPWLLKEEVAYLFVIFTAIFVVVYLTAIAAMVFTLLKQQGVIYE